MGTSSPSTVASATEPGILPATEAAPWDVEHVPTDGVARPRARPPAAGLVFAEAPLRAIAFAVDSALIAIVLQAPLALLGRAAQVLVFFGGASDPPPLVGLTPIAQAAVFVLVSAGFFVYFWRVFRASPGQMLLGLFVLGNDGRRLTVGRALLRWAVVFGPPTLLGLSFVSDWPFGLDDTSPLLRDVLLLIAAIPVLWPVLLGLTMIRDERG